MALIQCLECGKQVSDEATSCPSCGAPISALPNTAVPSMRSRDQTRKRRGVWPTFLVAFAVVAGVLFWQWRAANSEKAAPPSAGLAAAFRNPQKVVNEKVELKEGMYTIYSFTLSSDARIQVQVTAQPKHVDVMLMTNEEAEKFKKVSGNLFGGKYTYRQALSSKQILRMDQTEILPKGQWVIVVMRPSESLLFQKSTVVDVVVTVY